MQRLFKRWPAVVAVGATLLIVFVMPVSSNHGQYHVDATWAKIYHAQVFHLSQAHEMGYVPVSECTPGMGFHYAKPAEAEAWFAGKAGGLQVLLFDMTGYLVGVEYAFSAPSKDAPAIMGMSGPMDGHVPGMPIHYDQHIYFRAPKC